MQLQPGHARATQLCTSRTLVNSEMALEEEFFLGLRMNRGVSLEEIAARHGNDRVREFASAIAELIEAGLLKHCDDRLRLTTRGRLLSNEVFERFLREPQKSTSDSAGL